jgi:hypothetical protein
MMVAAYEKKGPGLKRLYLLDFRGAKALRSLQKNKTLTFLQPQGQTWVRFSSLLEPLWQ